MYIVSPKKLLAGTFQKNSRRECAMFLPQQLVFLQNLQCIKESNLGFPWIYGLLQPTIHFYGCFSFKSYNNFLKLEKLYAIYNKMVSMVAHLNLIGSMHAMSLVLRKKESQYIREYCKTQNIELSTSCHKFKIVFLQPYNVVTRLFNLGCILRIPSSLES